MAERRKPPGPKLRSKFRTNRIKRKFLQLRADELAEKVETADNAKKALEFALERERVLLKIKQLPVRRRPLKKDGNSSSSGGVLGGVFG